MNIIYGGTEKKNMELVKLISKDYFWFNPNSDWNIFFQYHEIDYQYRVVRFKNMKEELKRFVFDLPLGKWMQLDLLEDLQKFDDSLVKPLMGYGFETTDFSTTSSNLSNIYYSNNSNNSNKGKMKIPCQHFYIPIKYDEYKKHKICFNNRLYNNRNCIISTNDKITFNSGIISNTLSSYFAKELDYKTIKFHYNNLSQNYFQHNCTSTKHFRMGSKIEPDEFWIKYQEITQEYPYMKVEYKGENCHRYRECKATVFFSGINPRFDTTQELTQESTIIQNENNDKVQQKVDK